MTSGAPLTGIVPGAEPCARADATPRTGAELIRAMRPFQDERPWRSWWLFASTLAIFACSLGAIVIEPWWPLKVVGGAIAGLVQVRLFIFYHDAMHGAIFRNSRLSRALVTGLGYYLVAPHRVWKESHDFHHQNNAKMMGSRIGSFPLMTREEAAAISARRRLIYRVTRHPLTIAGGYFTVFMFGLVLGPFIRSPRTYWPGMLAMLLHYSLLAAITWQFGWVIGLCAVVVPSLVGTAVGSYLFYAQHNFPDMTLFERKDWTFTAAALRSSSMFDMSGLMHWFTGNIGYHHVHHLNHLVPFYRLPEAMRVIPELQRPVRTSWRIRDIAACFRLSVWDQASGRMLRYAEAAA